MPCRYSPWGRLGHVCIDVTCIDLKALRVIQVGGLCARKHSQPATALLEYKLDEQLPAFLPMDFFLELLFKGRTTDWAGSLAELGVPLRRLSGNVAGRPQINSVVISRAGSKWKFLSPCRLSSLIRLRDGGYGLRREICVLAGVRVSGISGLWGVLNRG